MIKFGIVGTSKIADQFIEVGRLHKNFLPVAVYSRKKETADEFSQKHNLEYSYTNLKEMAKSEKLDAVYIASPNSFHKSQAEIFLKNKIPVLLEKPLVSNEKEAINLFNTAKMNNTLLMEALIPVFEPRIQTAYKNLHKVGKIRRVVADYSQYSSRYTSFKAGAVENAFKKELSNGAVMDLGIYVVEPVVQAFGRPDSVVSSGKFFDFEVDAQGTIILNYGDMQAILSFSKVAWGYLPQEIQGETATMIIPRRLTGKDAITIIYHDGTKEIISYVQDMPPMYYEIEEFISLIKNNKTSSEILKPENSIHTFFVMDEYRKQIGLKFPADSN